MNKKKVLYITSFLPKRNASQAGVNITYNLMKIISVNMQCHLDLLCTLNSNEFGQNDNDIKELTQSQFYFEIPKMRKMLNIIKNITKPTIASVRFDKRVTKFLKNSTENYDYILIDYTQNIGYIDKLKKYFPNSKVAIIEHDVSFLGLDRKRKKSKGLKKILYNFEYKRLKNYEMKNLRKYDKIYTLNEKDKSLISNINNVEILTPFIGKWNIEKRSHSSFNIMYWGAMNRKENEIAVLDFLNNIWPFVNKENTKFYIIGANPSKKIVDLKDENIIVTGFVENPRDYFEVMDLSVVPLTLGAGIKIKVLESLANKIPVITTSVGAEGIKYKDEFIICDDFSEFAKHINYIKENEQLRKEMIIKSEKLIDEQFGFKGNQNILENFIK